MKTGGTDITIVEYIVYWDTDLGRSSDRVTPPNLNYQITGLDAGTTYQITVAAVNSAGSIGPRSAIFKEMTQLGLPGAPTGLMLDGSAMDAVTTKSILVKWDEPSDTGGTDITIAQYIVYWGTDLDLGSSSDRVTPTPDLINYQITGLDAGTTYQIAVAAVNSVGTGPRSAISREMTQVAPPGAPTGLMLNGPATAAITTESIRVEWSTPMKTGGTDITIVEYIVYWDTDLGRSSDRVTPPNLNYQITGLDAGTTYQITVAAVNSVGSIGPRSAIFKEMTQLGLPGAPTGLMLDRSAMDAVTTKSILVKWVEPSDTGGADITIARYIVYWGTDLDLGSSSDRVTAPDRNYRIPGLAAGTTYQIAVAAVNSVGTGPRSAIFEGMTQVGPPGAPTGLMLNGPATAAITTKSIRVEWSTPMKTGGTDITIVEYIVYWDTDLGRSSDRVTPPNLNYQITGLDAGTTYQITVAAVNSVGSIGPRSAIFKEMTQLALPGAPTGLMLDRSAMDAVTTKSILVKWVEPSDTGGADITIAQYIVYWDTDLGSSSDRVTMSELNYRITGLDAGTTYQITVAAVNSAGTGPRSAIFEGMTQVGPPGAPTGLMLNEPAMAEPAMAAVTTDSIMVKWRAPIETGGTDITIAGYIVYWGTDLNGISMESTDRGMSTVSSSSDKIVGLASNTTYQIAVEAVNSAAIVGTRSSEIAVQTKALPPLFSASPAIGTVTGDSIAVSWQIPASVDGALITGYTVYWLWTDGSGVTMERSADVPASPISYVIKGLSARTVYQVTVAAMNRSGLGPRSPISEVQTGAATVPTPPLLQQVVATTDSLAVRWSAPDRDGGAEITTYTVYWRALGQSEEKISVSATTILSYKIMNLDSSAWYEIAVAAENEVGLSARSALVEMRTTSLVTNPPALPPTPAQPLVGIITQNSIAISWTSLNDNGPDPITGYRVYWNLIGSIESSYLVNASTATTTNYVIEGLAEGMIYEIAVAAVNRGGPGARSERLFSKTLSRPAAPATPRTVNVSLVSITVAWNKPDDGGAEIMTYTVYWRAAGEENYRSTVVNA